MAIDYREVDATAVQEQVLLNRAAEAERAAYAAEMEVTRLQAVSGAAKTQEDRDALAALLTTAQDNATNLRATADRANSAGVLTSAQADEVHTQFLRSWVSSLEQEHVAHVTLVEENNKDIADAGVSADDKAAAQAAVASSTDAIDIIESSWHVATQALDATGVKPDVTPQSPTPAPTPANPTPDTPNEPAPAPGA